MTELEKEKLEKLNAWAAQKKLNPMKMAARFTAMYNEMDGRCQQLARSNPGRPMSDYCERCQKMFMRKLQ